jgi:Arc/MetJ-type ribon-helix-helix transcriptional regulator
MKRTTIWLDEKDKVAIREIRELYGLESDSAAIRFSLRVLSARETRVRLEDTEGRDKNQCVKHA